MARTGDAIFLHGKSWWLNCHIQGVRYQRLLGVGISRSVALKHAQAIRVAVWSGEFGKATKAKDVSFEEASKQFADWATANKKPSTTKHYLECLRQLASSFAGKRLSQISSFSIEAYKQKRLHRAPVAVNRELAVLKSLFNRCRELKLFVGDNPVKSVKLLKEPRRRLRFLESDEEARLLAACDEPLRTMIVIGTNCGLRLKSEALTLRWADVDLERKILTVQASYSKNGQTRSVPLNSVVLAVLNQLPRISEFVFAKPNGKPYHAIRGFRGACRKAGLTDVTPHTLRHTFATRLVEAGMDLRTVQEFGGWKTLALVQRYAHVSPGRMADAAECLVRYSASHSTKPEIRRIGQTA